MKKLLMVCLLLSFGLLLCAQQVADVRITQDIRYTGTVVSTSSGENWVLWEADNESGYGLWGMKYNSSGQAMFPNPLPIPLAAGNTRLIQAEAGSDNSLILLYMTQLDGNSVDLRVQKINSEGLPQWTPGGIILSLLSNYKHPKANICANNQGGAFVLYRSEAPNPTNIWNGLNFDAQGINIWTTNSDIVVPHSNFLAQLILTAAGDLIINSHSWQNSSYMLKVDNSGTPLGNNPLFDESAQLPQSPYLLKTTNDSFLLYSRELYGMNAIEFQKMDSAGNLLLDEIISKPIEDDFQGNLKIRALADGGFSLIYRCSFYHAQTQQRFDELFSQKLSADLQPQWGQGDVAVLNEPNVIRDADMIPDDAGNLWFSYVISDNNWNNSVVKVSKLDAMGNILLDAIPVSSDTQMKNGPQLSILTDQVMLSWGEFYEDKIAVKRQILSTAGQPQLPQYGVDVHARLSGTTYVHGVYSLGERSISLWDDDRYVGNQLHYQILDAQLSGILPENGIALSGDVREAQTFLAAAVSEENTLLVCHKVYKGDGNFDLYVQEIDANGVRSYPGHGLLLQAGFNGMDDAAIAFHEGAKYLYWVELAQSRSFSTIIKGQKIIGTSPMWQEGGITIYHQANIQTVYLHAKGPYLAFVAENSSISSHIATAIRIEADGSLTPGWDPEGLPLVINSPYHFFAMVRDFGLIQDDMYCVFLDFCEGGFTLKVQKVNPAGERLWGDYGLSVADGYAGFIDVSSIVFNDHLSMVYHLDAGGSFLQKIDQEGNLVYGTEGISLPGNYGNSSTDHLVQYDNGSYSYFWRDYAVDNTVNIKHVYVNSGGSLQETQLIRNGNLVRVHSALNNNSCLLISSELSYDLFSWETKAFVNVYALSIPEPISITDPVQEQISPVLIGQNYPNPFRESTRISYKLPEAGTVRLQIFNIKGQLVQEYEFAAKAAGDYHLDWDGRDSRGNRCAGGIYLYKLHSGRFSAGKKMILLR